MTENLIAYSKKAIEIGAAGIFMSVPAAKEIVRRDVFLTFVKPYAAKGVRRRLRVGPDEHGPHPRG